MPPSWTRSARPVLAIAVAATAVAALIVVLSTARNPVPAGPGDATVPARPVATCDRSVAPGGDDSGDGSTDRPFGTVQHLAESLEPGQTGCLASGDFTGELSIRRGGSADRPITLTAAPSATTRPVLRGRVLVDDSADHVVISGLTLNGRNPDKLPSPTVNGDDVVLRGNEITNDNSGICVNLGHPTYGAAVGTVIVNNRIHNCGEIPATNLEHGIYVGTARDTTIEGNLIYANADRGIQLYPDAQDTRVTNNVIDGNGTGVIFSGADGTVSSDNQVVDNIISNSERYNVDAFWSDTVDRVGEDNLVEGNCLWGAGIEEISDEPGFTESGNLVIDPGFADRASGRFTIAPGNPCAERAPEWVAP